jgi:NADH-quinone oxidoreductase subunit E
VSSIPNHLLEKHPQEVQAILDKYPADQKRSAVMPLLYLAQREQGYITKAALSDISEITGVSATDVASLVGYYTLYHEQPGGKIRIQVCNDLPCALRGADEFLEKLCENLGIKVGETTPDGLVTIEAVMCLAGCQHAPLFQVQTGNGLEYHEDQTVESAMQLISEWRKSGIPTGVLVNEAVAAEHQEGPGQINAQDSPGGATVYEVAAKGISQLTRKERVSIQEEAGQ